MLKGGDMGEHTSNLERRIFKAGAFVLIAHVLFKLAGLIQAKVMGHYLPPETFDVVYTFAFENCLFMVFLIGEELLGPTFLPVFMGEKGKGDGKGVWQFASTVLTVQFLALLVVTALFLLFPDAAVRLLTRWEPGSEKFVLASKAVRTMAPALLGLSLGSTTYALLNGHKRFFLAAFGDAAWKFCAVGVVFVGCFFLKADGAKMLMWGLVAGAGCKVLTHLLGLRDKLANLRPSLDFSHPALKRLMWLMLPLVAGVLVTKFRDNFNNVYVPSALDAAGLMQANSIGKKLQSTLSFIVPYTLSVAVFPFLCEQAGDEDREGMGRLVTRFGRMLLAVFAPCSLFVAVAAVPFTALVFKGGHIDSAAVERIAVSLACYTFVLPAAAIEPLMTRAFFASRRMVSVTVIGVCFSLLSVLISWAGLRLSGGNGLLLLAFIAGGFTLTRILKCVALMGILKREMPVFPLFETLSFLARVGVAAGVASGAVWLLLYRVGVVAGLHGRMGDLLKIGIAGTVFAVIYLVAAYGLRIGEIRDLFVVVRDKVRKRA
jgi:putative peptidoglycan lipid II flippase